MLKECTNSIFKDTLETILDEEFAEVNMKRQEWDPSHIADRIIHLLEEVTGMNWK